MLSPDNKLFPRIFLRFTRTTNYFPGFSCAFPRTACDFPGFSLRVQYLHLPLGSPAAVGFQREISISIESHSLRATPPLWMAYKCQFNSYIKGVPVLSFWVLIGGYFLLLITQNLLYIFKTWSSLLIYMMNSEIFLLHKLEIEKVQCKVKFMGAIMYGVWCFGLVWCSGRKTLQMFKKLK